LGVGLDEEQPPAIDFFFKLAVLFVDDVLARLVLALFILLRVRESLVLV